jgi:hypothetical protein
MFPRINLLELSTEASFLEVLAQSTINDNCHNKNESENDRCMLRSKTFQRSARAKTSHAAGPRRVILHCLLLTSAVARMESRAG